MVGVRRWLGPLVAAALIGACATGPERASVPPTPSPAASPSPVASPTGAAPAAASPRVATPNPGTGAGAVVVWCAITRGDGSTAPTASAPPTLPAGLTADSVEPADAAFGVWFEPWVPHPALYAVGPRGASCGVDVGTGFVWWIRDASSFEFSYNESWSTDPPMWMGCPYLESARRDYLSSLGSSGEAIDSALCAPDVGDQIFPIPSDAPGLELALVLAGPPREGGPTVRLHGYEAHGPRGGGSGFIAKCPVSGANAARCAASLAFVAWSVGGGVIAADAIRQAFSVMPRS